VAQGEEREEIRALFGEGKKKKRIFQHYPTRGKKKKKRIPARARKKLLARKKT
jgi:hypothetical protein